MYPIYRLCCACLGLALAASAASAERPGPEAEDWTPVATSVLEDTRGGFALNSGLMVSFGLERLVSLNGNVVSRTSLQVADLTRLSPEQAQQTRDALSSVKLIQNGHDNIYVGAAPGQLAGGTVVQNNLNDQVIRSQTVISASLNSLALLKALQFQQSLGDALAGAAGPH
ncbi:MAG: hypothetical protein ACJ8LG_20710 [Massilia sp.]